jgi:outer membrane cobalamin receptor
VPTFADLFYQDARVEGKPDLLPEKSRNADFGAGWQIDAWGKFSAEVTHFHYTIDDLIVWRLGSFEVFRPFNTDAEIRGEEYSFSAQSPHEWVTLELGYTHLLPLNKNKNETTFDKIIPYRPQSSMKMGLGLNLKNWHASVNFRDVGARFITEANTKEMPAYQVWDANLAWSWKISGLELGWKFSVFNLADEKYEIIRDMPLPPREWRVGLSVTY